MEKVLKELLPSGQFQGVSPQRSKLMASIKSNGNKTTELRLRLGLVRAGCRGWKINVKELKGKPDIYFPGSGLIIFTDGCYWHGCERCGHLLRVNSKFWKTKILRNRERDAQITRQLADDGFAVLRFWEHDLAENLDGCINRIRCALRSSDATSYEC